jgi:AraC-like DNA-binding protein
MDDFASAAMVRVLMHGMTALGLPLPATATAPPVGTAQVPLDLKRTLVAAAVAQRGLACLPRLGRGVLAFPDDPTHRALTAARDGLEVLVRWQRLERYVHSAHRTELEVLGDARVALRHVSVRRGEAPSAAEDLVVIGVLAALLEAIGLEAPRATIDGVDVLAAIDGDEAAHETMLQRLAGAGRTGGWTLHWNTTATAASRRPAPAAAVTAPGGQAAPLDLCEALPWPDVARRCARDALADPLRPRTLGEAASALGMSTRGLQRLLAAAGLTWSTVMAEARVRSASWWLLETVRPIAEIGFLAGYSDQAHFTRDFGRRVGLPPGRYRSEFTPRSTPPR